MRPAFKEGGVGTAGNTSVIRDGAAALILMSEEKARQLGCRIMACRGADMQFKTFGVIAAGQMGSGIARVAAASGKRQQAGGIRFI